LRTSRRRVDLPAEDDHRAAPARARRRRNADRIAQIARPVAVELVGRSLCAGQHNGRRLVRQQPVDQENRLLHRVRAVRDDHRRSVLEHAARQRQRERAVHVEARDTDEVVELEGRRIRPRE